MNEAYIYEVPAQDLSSAKAAIIMLPDIFGQTDYAKQTATNFMEQLKQPVFMLDYFYHVTGVPTNAAQSEGAKVFALIEKLNGEDFVKTFNQAIAEISKQYPNIQAFSVIGFCFGGRLAYLAGLEPRVTNIVSLYGAGPNNPFYKNKSVVEALSEVRGNDSKLRILSFFGTQDDGIPADDRQKVADSFKKAGINYTAKQYDAGHAYFQQGRASYVEAAAKSSWTDLKTFFS